MKGYRDNKVHIGVIPTVQDFYRILFTTSRGETTTGLGSAIEVREIVGR